MCVCLNETMSSENADCTRNVVVLKKKKKNVQRLNQPACAGQLSDQSGLSVHTVTTGLREMPWLSGFAPRGGQWCCLPGCWGPSGWSGMRFPGKTCLLLHWYFMEMPSTAAGGGMHSHAGFDFKNNPVLVLYVSDLTGRIYFCFFFWRHLVVGGRQRGHGDWLVES